MIEHSTDKLVENTAHALEDTQPLPVIHLSQTELEDVFGTQDHDDKKEEIPVPAKVYRGRCDRCGIVIPWINGRCPACGDQLRALAEFTESETVSRVQDLDVTGPVAALAQEQAADSAAEDEAPVTTLTVHGSDTLMKTVAQYTWKEKLKRFLLRLLS